MSLVERALKKLQEDRKTDGGGQKPVAPVVVAKVVREPAGAPASAAVDSDRVEPARKKVSVSRAALREAGVIPPADRERLIADQYRRIKRALIGNISGKVDPPILHPRLVMMTSALSGDGKTYTSVNLALSLAGEKDRTCLLVDGDVAKPHVGNLFGVQEEPGLLDALQDESVDVESLILPTDVPGLSILPAGRRTDQATELLSSERMLQILQRLESRDPRRIAVVDSPPILLSSEARVLTNLVGQIVFVVRAGVTPKPAVLEALGQIDEGRYVGLILNQSEAAHASSYYGYGYGYGAGYGADRNSEDGNK
jgi:exopolysaccharide/PEP-CTERM locus tyrosine autokinase